MDALRVEHIFARALGITTGKRGDVNDADYVRDGQPKYLVKALEKALGCLKKRAEAMQDSDTMKTGIVHSISDLELVQEGIERNPVEVSHFACWNLWCTSAVSLDLIDKCLREREL